MFRAVLAVIAFLIAPVVAHAVPPYDGVVMSTGTGTATHYTAGMVEISASSVTASTPTIVFTGSSGQGLFIGSVTAPNLSFDEATLSTLGTSTGSLAQGSATTYLHVDGKNAMVGPLTALSSGTFSDHLTTAKTLQASYGYFISSVTTSGVVQASSVTTTGGQGIKIYNGGKSAAHVLADNGSRTIISNNYNSNIGLQDDNTKQSYSLEFGQSDGGYIFHHWDTGLTDLPIGGFFANGGGNIKADGNACTNASGCVVTSGDAQVGVGGRYMVRQNAIGPRQINSSDLSDAASLLNGSSLISGYLLKSNGSNAVVNSSYYQTASSTTYNGILAVTSIVSTTPFSSLTLSTNTVVVGSVTATYFVGDGSKLLNVPSGADFGPSTATFATFLSTAGPWMLASAASTTTLASRSSALENYQSTSSLVIFNLGSSTATLLSIDYAQGASTVAIAAATTTIGSRITTLESWQSTTTPALMALQLWESTSSPVVALLGSSTNTLLADLYNVGAATITIAASTTTLGSRTTTLESWMSTESARVQAHDVFLSTAGPWMLSSAASTSTFATWQSTISPVVAILGASTNTFSVWQGTASAQFPLIGSSTGAFALFESTTSPVIAALGSSTNTFTAWQATASPKFTTYDTFISTEGPVVKTLGTSTNTFNVWMGTASPKLAIGISSTCASGQFLDGATWTNGLAKGGVCTTSSGSSGAQLASTQTFSGANTFLSTTTMGPTGYSVNGVSISSMGFLANHWQVVASTYVVNNSSVSFYVPESFSSATWRFYTQGGMPGGGSNSAVTWYVRFDNNSSASYLQAGFFMNGGGASLNIGSGQGTGGTGCRFQQSGGTPQAGVDSMEFTTDPFSPQAQNPGRINIGWRANYTYSGLGAQVTEYGMCYVEANSAPTAYHTISLVPPVGYTGWVFLEKLFVPYR